MFYAHALNSEHAQYALWFYANAYWLEWTEIAAEGCSVYTPIARFKREPDFEDDIYKYMYPMGCTSPKFYGLPKIHKTNIPLRSIVSNRASVTYGIAKVMAKILKPLVGKSPHHIQSTKDFVARVGKVNLQPGECLHT